VVSGWLPRTLSFLPHLVCVFVRRQLLQGLVSTARARGEWRKQYCSPLSLGRTTTECSDVLVSLARQGLPIPHEFDHIMIFLPTSFLCVTCSLQGFHGHSSSCLRSRQGLSSWGVAPRFYSSAGTGAPAPR